MFTPPCPPLATRISSPGRARSAKNFPRLCFTTVPVNCTDNHETGKTRLYFAHLNRNTDQIATFSSIFNLAKAVKMKERNKDDPDVCLYLVSTFCILDQVPLYSKR